ncbi:MAG: hypothetical protein U0800_12810 [Isosphaeraceae bacterium]
MAPDVIAQRNAANAQFSTGPRTPEGKAVSSGNAEVHGFCSVEPRTPEDRVEAEALYGMLAAELKPATPMEVEAVREAANADQRRRRIGRALEDVAAASIEVRREERQGRLAEEHRQCEAEVAFWKAVQESPPAIGVGWKPAVLESVLDRFGVGVKGHPEDRRVDLVRLHQAVAQGDDRLRQALKALRAKAKEDPVPPDHMRILEDSGRGCRGLIQVAQDCLAEATEALAASAARLSKNQENPARADDWFDDSKRAQLLHRYKAEADRAYYRALRSFDAIRRRRDAERRQVEREQRQARREAQEAEKASRQAARQAEIDARAKPNRDEVTAKVVEPFVARASQRNELQVGRIPAGTEALAWGYGGHAVAHTRPGTPRVVRRRGKAVVIEARTPSRRR